MAKEDNPTKGKIRRGGRMRQIINRKVLLDMMDDVRAGKIQQKDIAAHFGVSQSAITQALKKIIPHQLPDSFKSLTPKEQKFAMAVAQGQTQTTAAMASFDVTTRESAKTIGTRLMKDSHVIKAVNDAKESIAAKFEKKGYGQDFRIEKLGEHMNNTDPVVSLKALDLSWKLDSSYAPEKHISVFSVREEVIRTDEKLRETEAMIAQLREELGMSTEEIEN